MLHAGKEPRIPASKRAFDLVLTIIAMPVLAPILLILAILVRIDTGEPILFKQKRPGFKNKPFWIYKFRTMSDARDAEQKLLSDRQRITSLGRFLRTYSLDELPEIVNVLKGEMSWVGPRPLLMQYLERYSPEQVRRHEVVPGITGWAQINGRNALSWEQKFEYDVWYVDHWSFWLDFKIILITAIKVLRREGINQPGHATAEEFMGSDES